MNDSLYQALGVKKDSDKEVVKKAYRNKSKTCHPDHGGSEEDFNTISVAYRVLVDDKRRARYDSGEDADDILRSAASEQTKIQDMLAGLFCGLIEQGSPDTDDLVKLMIDNIDINIAGADNGIRKLESFKKKFEIASRRVKAKKNNLLKEVALAKIKNIEREIKNLEGKRGDLISCKKYLEDFSYEFDTPSPFNGTSGMFFFSTNI